MSSLPVIVNALVPIALVIMLGFLAGRIGLIKPENSGVLASLVLDFCLPALLFNATATMTTAELHDWRFFLGMALGLLVIYFLALVLSLAIFRKPIAASSLQALSSAFPSMALVGIPLLSAVSGTAAVLPVVFGNLVASLVLVPLTLTLLEAGRPAQAEHARGTVVWGSLLQAINSRSSGLRSRDSLLRRPTCQSPLGRKNRFP
jgi:predicted permease